MGGSSMVSDIFIWVTDFIEYGKTTWFRYILKFEAIKKRWGCRSALTLIFFLNVVETHFS